MSDSHNKPCTLCHTPRPVLVRCQIDATGKWHLVCPGKCWISVSGGNEDARGHEAEFPHYKYGGMWKNRHADGPVSAKKPGKVKRRQKEGRNGKKGVGSGESQEQPEGQEVAGNSDGSDGNDDAASEISDKVQDPEAAHDGTDIPTSAIATSQHDATKASQISTV